MSAEPEKEGFHTKMGASEVSTEQGKSQSQAVVWAFQQRFSGSGHEALRFLTHTTALVWLFSPTGEWLFPLAANDAALLVHNFGGL